MSRARRRGLARLAVLVVVMVVLVVIVTGGLSSGGPQRATPSSTGSSPDAARSGRLSATRAQVRLPVALHGATAASSGARLLVIGGANRQDVSTDEVVALDPATGTATRYGTLTEPLHDAAAAGLGSRTLVFGGGATAAVDTVQRLNPRARGEQVGRLPDPASDLSAAGVGNAVYLVGGYDGRQPLNSILRTTDGATFTRVASLPTAVRYTALAVTDGRLYAFGGELASGGDTDRIQSYDPVTHRASVVGHLTRGIDHAAALNLGGTVYLLGGRSDGVATDRILRFDRARGAMVPAGRLPTPLFDAAAGVVSGVGYLAGGIGPQGTSVASIVTLRP